MHDLMSYKDARIEALEKELSNQRIENTRLATFVYELIDKDCPEDYKRIVKQQVFESA